MKLLNPEAETLLLSTLMRHLAKVGALCVEKNLTRDTFADAGNSQLYSYLLGAWGEGKAIERFRMAQDLRAFGLLEAVGGIDRVQALFVAPAIEAAAADYIDAIKDAAARRRLLVTTGQAHTDLQSGTPTEEVLASLRGAVDTIDGTSPVDTPTPKQMTAEVIDRAEGGALIRTGFGGIDQLCGGVRRGDMLVISGQAKAGKSTLAANIARNVANRGFVAIFTIEMNRAEYWKRMLIAESEVPSSYFDALRQNQSDDHTRMLEAVLPGMMSLPLTIIDRITDIDQAIALCAMLKQKHGGLSAVVFDYLQLFSCEALRGASTTGMVSGISARIKRAAAALQTLAIVPCQLNDDNRALDSRAAERDCNLMLKIDRNEDTNERKVIVGYNRAGPMGIPLHMKAELHFNRFRQT